MNSQFNDIRRLTDAEPSWFDENATPRYCEFSPRVIADIYADEAVLLEIACQQCGHLFIVCISQSLVSRIRDGHESSLREQISDGSIHFGDPPNIGCCPAGPTMNCEDRRVLQYWVREGRPLTDWVRKPEMEIELPEQ